MSPTKRSLKALRDAGYTCAVVEHWNPYAKIRQDLFGVIDILAVGETGIIGVQTTTQGNAGARIKKSMAEPRLRAWLAAGGKFIIHGWSKRGGRGKRKTWGVTVYRAFLAGGNQVVFEQVVFEKGE